MVQLSKMLPACGFVIAVALVGVTSAFKDAPKTRGEFLTYSFEYNPPTPATDPYSEDNVEDPANWQYNAATTPCIGDDKACSLLNVPAAFVNTGGTPTLKASINIDALENSSGVAKVDATAASLATISNQSN